MNGTFLHRPKEPKYGPITTEQRARMAACDDLTDAGVERRGRELLDVLGPAAAAPFAGENRKAHWPGAPGYEFWGRVQAWIALQVDEAEAPIAAVDVEDLPGPDDLSDAAKERWARVLLAKYDWAAANERVTQWRDMYAPSSPKASFWSRVQVEILAPASRRNATTEAAPVAADPTPPSGLEETVPPAPVRVVEAVVTPAYALNVKSGVTQEAYAAPGGPPARWFEERRLVVEPLKKPEPRQEREPDQGRLF